MAAQYIIDNIIYLPRVKEIRKVDQFNLKVKIDNIDRHIYTPSNTDYEVTIDIVDKAIKLGANLIVCDLWIKITGAGMSHAKANGVNIYKAGAFFSRLRGDDKV